MSFFISLLLVCLSYSTATRDNEANMRLNSSNTYLDKIIEGLVSQNEAYKNHFIRLENILKASQQCKCENAEVHTNQPEGNHRLLQHMSEQLHKAFQLIECLTRGGHRIGYGGIVCIVHHKEKKNWFDAAEICKNESGTLFLPDPHNLPDLHNALDPIIPIKKEEYRDFWIGARFIDDELKDMNNKTHILPSSVAERMDPSAKGCLYMYIAFRVILYHNSITRVCFSELLQFLCAYSV